MCDSAAANCQSGDLVGAADLRLPLLLAVAVDVGVGQDPVQPGAQVRALGERPERRVGLEEGLLDQVLGIRRVARHPERGGVQLVQQRHRLGGEPLREFLVDRRGGHRHHPPLRLRARPPRQAHSVHRVRPDPESRGYRRIPTRGAGACRPPRCGRLAGPFGRAQHHSHHRPFTGENLDARRAIPPVGSAGGVRRGTFPQVSRDISGRSAAPLRPAIWTAVPAAIASSTPSSTGAPRRWPLAHRAELHLRPAEVVQQGDREREVRGQVTVADLGRERRAPVQQRRQPWPGRVGSHPAPRTAATSSQASTTLAAATALSSWVTASGA